jgi:cellobiose-specific phosphotransferase system component IIA
MYGELIAAVNSLKALADISKGLMSLHTMAEVQGKAIELNQVILDAQQSLFAAHSAQTSLVDEVRDLKGQIAAMKNWDAEKQRYQMATPYSGVTVFRKT